MEVLIQILHFLLSLSILIVIHEFGHFIGLAAFKGNDSKTSKIYRHDSPFNESMLFANELSGRACLGS